MKVHWKPSERVRPPNYLRDRKKLLAYQPGRATLCDQGAYLYINVSYAAYFNRKRRRFGHLFQGRFKAVLVDADQYLKHLSLYIHRNPVRAGIVAHCKGYAWSNYPVFAGYSKVPKWLETSWLWSLFGKNPDEAKKGYRNFVESVRNQEIENPSKDIVSGAILGGADFVTWVKQEI
jgi:putative transposase